MTDVELDARVTVLEENSGVGTENGKSNHKFLDICMFISNMKINKKSYKIFYVLETIAFHSILTSYSSIPDESAVLFNEVLLNEGLG